MASNGSGKGTTSSEIIPMGKAIAIISSVVIVALLGMGSLFVFGLGMFDTLPIASTQNEPPQNNNPNDVIPSTSTPTPEPTPEPTVKPTDEPEPTPEPTDEPTEQPTVEPSISPTPKPTAVPTPEPTIAPTPIPTIQPTIAPTPIPTIQPTVAPIPQPTIIPMPLPTVIPTQIPAPLPTIAPTPQPTITPTPIPMKYYDYFPTPTVPDIGWVVEINSIPLAEGDNGITMSTGGYWVAGCYYFHNSSDMNTAYNTYVSVLLSEGFTLYTPVIDSQSLSGLNESGIEYIKDNIVVSLGRIHGYDRLGFGLFDISDERAVEMLENTSTPQQTPTAQPTPTPTAQQTPTPTAQPNTTGNNSIPTMEQMAGTWRYRKILHDVNETRPDIAESLNESGLPSAFGITISFTFYSNGIYSHYDNSFAWNSDGTMNIADGYVLEETGKFDITDGKLFLTPDRFNASTEIGSIEISSDNNTLIIWLPSKGRLEYIRQ